MHNILNHSGVFSIVIWACLSVAGSPAAAVVEMVFSMSREKHPGTHCYCCHQHSSPPLPPLSNSQLGDNNCPAGDNQEHSSSSSIVIIVAISKDQRVTISHTHTHTHTHRERERERERETTIAASALLGHSHHHPAV